MKNGFDVKLPKGKAFAGMGGVYVALMTPFKKNGKQNLERISEQVESYLRKGICGFYVAGSTGEGMLQTPVEREHLAEAVLDANAGRGKVIVHVGCLNTDDSVRLAKHAARHGADWISSVAPVYFGQTFPAVLRHYRKIATATDLPFLIYSIGQVLDPVRDVQLFDIPNVCGMKYTGSDFFALMKLIHRLKKPAIFFSGLDQLFVPAYSTGCFAGCIGTTQNIIPAEFVAMYKAMRANDFARASRLQAEANQVVMLMTENENWSYRKAMVRFTGLDVGPARPPYEPLSEAEYVRWEERIREQGIVPEGK